MGHINGFLIDELFVLFCVFVFSLIVNISAFNIYIYREKCILPSKFHQFFNLNFNVHKFVMYTKSYKILQFEQFVN